MVFHQRSQSFISKFNQSKSVKLTDLWCELVIYGEIMTQVDQSCNYLPLQTLRAIPVYMALDITSWIRQILEKNVNTPIYIFQKKMCVVLPIAKQMKKKNLRNGLNSWSIDLRKIIEVRGFSLEFNANSKEYLPENY